jgi:tetratricopeptide (TPR) repeat protein
MRVLHRSILVVMLAVPGAAAAIAAPEPPAAPFADWSNETLFDATTTRAELLEMARAAVTLEQFPLAEIYYREILLRLPNDVTAMWELAAMYRRTGRLEYARGLLTRAAALQPGRSDINVARREVEIDLFRVVQADVDSLMRQQRYSTALPRVAVLLSIDEENTAALANKARCLAALGQYDAALSTLKLAILRDPQDEYYRMRDAYTAELERRRIGNLEADARRLLASGSSAREQAAEVLQAILSQDPTNEWARNQFRALSEGRTPELPSDPPAPQQVVDAVRDVAPGFAALLNNHLALILGFLTLLLMFRSPLTRAIAARAHRPSQLAGDLACVGAADVLRAAHGAGLSGVLHFRSLDGNARVFLQDRDPVHCTGYGRQGNEALSHLIREVETGRFEHRPHRGNVKPTIDQPLAVILANGVSDPGVKPAGRVRKKSRMSELLDSNVDS